jgi:integrase
MATLKRHRSGTYHIRFQYRDQQWFRSLDTGDEKKAQQALARVEETISLLKTGRLTVPPTVDDVGSFILSGGKAAVKPKPREVKMTLGEVIDKYFEAIPPGAKSGNSIDTERTHLGHFGRILKKSTYLNSIGIEALQQYVTVRSKETGHRGKKIQPQTIRKEITTFGQLWRFAKARGWVDRDFDRRGLQLPKPAAKARYQTGEDIVATIGQGGLTEGEIQDLWRSLFLREEEIQKFLAYAREKGSAPWFYPAIATAAYTGARRSEIRRSEVSDFDFKRGIVTIREKKRKAQSYTVTYRYVDLHPDLAKIIKAWLKQHPGGKYTFCSEPNVKVTPHQANQAFNSTVLNSEWAKMTGWHIMRHSFISICASKGLPQATIDEWVGHETDEQKARYRHLFREHTREAMGQLFASKSAR